MDDTMTRKELLEDFNFLYAILKRYYPYFAINKLVNSIDWLGNKDVYEKKVLECKTAKDFYNTINFEILSEINNGHTHILPIEMAMGMYIYYKNLEKNNWRLELAKVFERPRVKKRYEITEKNMERFPDQSQYNLQEQGQRESNIKMGDVVAGKLAYIAIKEMIHPDLNDEIFKDDYEILRSYLERIKEYPILIIDIRGNGGGDSKYWTDFLMPLIVDRKYSQNYYSFVKEGELLERVIEHYNYKAYREESKKGLKFPETTLKILESFSYFATDTLQVTPHKDSIKFRGKIYLLIDKEVFSSSEMLAFFAKETKLATLIGERTSGDGIGSDPLLIDLPNSGFVLRFSKEMGVTEMGSINELDKTRPDIAISNPEKKIKFDCHNIAVINNDQAIMSILSENNPA